MYNIHTKETLTIAYKRNGAVIPEAMEKINHFMRDWRRDEIHRMDPDLIDLLWSLHEELGSREPMHLISGYRSPRTNESLRRSGGGQARFSQHMLGKAADIQFPDIPIKQLRYAALIRERGGVGYYPNSGISFVHVDTGNVRAWPKLPRMELALLFPSGHTRHVPRDGRPLTREDARVALASLRNSGGELPLALRRHNQPHTVTPVLASFSPGQSPFALAKAEKVADARPALPADYAAPTAAKPLATAMASPPVAQTKDQTPAPAALTPASFDPGAAPLSTAANEVTTVTSEYDDEDPDEFYYQPFPLAPLMTDASVASVDFDDEPRAAPVATSAMMFAEANAMLSFNFERGLQYANLYWASRFAGSAVSGVLASQAAKRGVAGIAVAARSPRRHGHAPSAVASNAGVKAPAAGRSAAPAPVAVAAATKSPSDSSIGKSQPEKGAAPVAVATASAAGSGGGESSGSSIWSIFSAPSVSYGFGSGN